MSESTMQAPPAATAAENAPQEQNIIETVMGVFWSYIFPYLWLYVASAVLFLIGAFIYLHTATPLYRSSSQIYVDNKQYKVLRVDGLTDPTFESKNFMNTQIMMLTGKENVNQTYATLGLKDEDRALVSAPEATLMPGTNVISVSVTSSNAALAAKVANGLVQSYIAMLHDRKTVISNSGLDILRSQLAEITERHDASVKELLEYKKENGIYDFTASYNQMLDRLNAQNDIILQNEAKAEEIQSLITDISEHRENAAIMLPVLVSGHNLESANAGAIGVLGSNNLSTLQNLMLQHEMALPELTAKYGSNSLPLQIHAKVSQMITDAQDREIDISLAGLRLSREMLIKHNDLLKARADELSQRLALLDQLSGEYKRREAATAALARTMEMLVSRMNEIQIADASEQLTDFSVFIVDAAVPAARAYFPQTKKVLGMAIVLGLALAGAVSFILVSINTEVTDAATINGFFGGKLTDFGKLPSFSLEDYMAAAKSEGKGDDKKAQSEDDFKRKLQLDIDEAFRNIRTSLNLSIATRNSKTLAVSSSISGEGKTFFSCNLARSYAQANKHVLLIDADLRKPSIVKFFKDKLPEGVSATQHKGLSNVLVGDCRLEEAVIHLADPEIDVLGVGPVPPNPNELLSGGALSDLIAKAKQEYDMVIFDTSPVGLVADALLIFNQNVPFLLLSRLFSTTKSQLQGLAQRLRQLNVAPVGMITNYVDAPATSYGYGYGYGYGKYGRYGRYGYGKYGYGKYGHYGYGKYGHYGAYGSYGRRPSQDDAAADDGTKAKPAKQGKGGKDGK